MKKITTLCLSLVIAMTAVAGDWTLVTSAADLQVGDQIVLAYVPNGLTASATLASNTNKTSYWLSPVNSTFDGMSLLTPGEGTGVFVLEGEPGAWKFALIGAEGVSYLGATATNKLSYAATATNTWSIDVTEEGDATIASINTSYGAIYYSSATGTSRFSVYTASSTKKPIQIYHIAVVPSFGLRYLGYPYKKTSCANPTFEAGSELTLSAFVPTKEDDEFLGWEYAGVLYEPGALFIMPEEEVVLVPRWKNDIVEGISAVVSAPKATKEVRDGMLVIIRDGEVFNVLGERIQ